MLRSPFAYDPWPWSSVSPLRSMDHEFRRFFDLLWSPVSSSYCDENGVLTLSPSYQAKQTKDYATIQVEIPGVERNGVAVEAEGNRLKIVAAKYSHDDRSCMCSKQKAKGNNTKGKSSKASSTSKKSPPLPTVVYKLNLKVPSRSDLDSISAKYRGDGILHLNIPMKKDEQVRKVFIAVNG